MLKTSDYLIYTKLDSEENKYLLIHGYTGAADIVSEGIYNALKQAETDSSELEKLDQEHLEILEKRGYITGMTQQEERETVKMIANAIMEVELKTGRPISIYLVPTYNCNFRCAYCYENGLLKNGKKWIEKKMSFKTVDAVFNGIKVYKDEKRLLSVGLYGGEPLLKENYELIKYIVEKCQEHELSLSAVTNGYELEHFKDMLGAGKISTLQITLDGTEEMHNQKRYLEGKKPTFSKIIDNIDMCLQKEVSVNIRSNIDKKNIDERHKLLELFEEKGWTKNSNFSRYVSPMLLTSEVTPDYDATKEVLLDSASECSSMINFQFTQMFQQKSFVDFKTFYCGGAGSILSIDPFGDIYPCLDVLGKNENIVGTVNDTDFFGLNNKYDYWANRTVQKIEECLDCAYVLFCGGGCLANAQKVHGNMYKPYCNLFTEVFRKTVPEAYLKATSKMEEYA